MESSIKTEPKTKSQLTFSTPVRLDETMVLEIDQDMLNTLLNQEILMFAGQRGTNAAVCSNSQTKQLRQVVNSNTCLVVYPEIQQTPCNVLQDYKQQIIPLNLPPKLDVTDIVSCQYDLLPPPSTDPSYTFQQLVTLYPTKKQFSLEHMKLMHAIYKENHQLYHKLVTGLDYNIEFCPTIKVKPITTSKTKSLYASKNPVKVAEDSTRNNTIIEYNIPSSNPKQQQQSLKKSFNTKDIIHFGPKEDYEDIRTSMTSPTSAKKHIQDSKNINTTTTPNSKRDSSLLDKVEMDTMLLTNGNDFEDNNNGNLFTPHKRQQINNSSDIFTIQVTKSQNSSQISLSSSGYNPKLNKTIGSLFEWTSTTTFPALYGYTIHELSQIIQLSQNQLSFQLSTFPVIMLENKFSLIAYDVITYILQPILDICALFRTKFHIPTVVPSALLAPNKTTGLITSTPAVIVHRNMLLHELEYDNVADPTSILSVLLHFIDWDLTYQMYNKEEIEKRATVMESSNPKTDAIIAASKHNYAYYNTFYHKKVFKKLSKTKSIPNNFPELYENFDAYSYHINDLLNYPQLPTQHDDQNDMESDNEDHYINSAKCENSPINQTAFIYETYIKPNPASFSQYTKQNMINNIPPIFVLSISKVLQFYTNDIILKHYLQQQTTYDTSNLWTKLQQALPNIGFAKLLEQLQTRLLPPILPNLSSILLDLAGTVIIHDPVYTAQHGYHPMFNTADPKPTQPPHPLTFNVEEYSPRSVAYLFNLTAHYPLYYQILEENGIHLTNPNNNNTKGDMLNKTIMLSFILNCKDRFHYIFKDKKQWAISTIKPFLESIVSYNTFNQDLLRENQDDDFKTDRLDSTTQDSEAFVFIYPAQAFLKTVAVTSIDALLLKYARAVTFKVKDAKGNVVQTNVVYGPR